MIRVDWNDPDLELIGVDAGGGDIFHYKNVPFTGIVFEKFNNGNLNYEREFVSGYAEGVERHYFENGQLMEESFIKYNQEYGLLREWDENGNLIHTYDWGAKP